MKISQIAWLVVAGLVAGCGGDTPESTSDAGPGVDACVGSSCQMDGGSDDGGADDAGDDDAGDVDAGTLLPSEPVIIALSATGHDRVYAVTHDAEGNVYATGQISDSILSTSDFEMFVAKLTPAGVLDADFGDNGITRVNVAVGGTSREVGRGIVIQSTGRIVIAGAAEHDPAVVGLLSGDTDIFLVGFEPDGDLDPTFGDGVHAIDGVQRIEAGTGVVTTDSMGMDVLSGADAPWGLALGPSDRLAIQTSSRLDEERNDTDYTVIVRLADGGVDTSFGGGDGIVSFDVGGVNNTARTLTFLDDGAILAAGYTTSSVLVRPIDDPAETSQQPVIYRLTPTGEFDSTFATTDVYTTPGIWHDFATPLPARRNAEAYGNAVLSDGRTVTIGYGPTPIEGGMGSDLVSFRFTANGDLDPTYGTDGYVYLDVGMLGDNGRHIIVLPDDRTLSVGAGRPAPASGATAEQDALVWVLSGDGVPDATFGERGLRLYDLGGNDHFWGAHVHESSSGDSVAIGGIAAGEVVDTDDDDSAFVFIGL